MLNKLSRKDIELLNILAQTPEGKSALNEYIEQHEKAVKAYKIYRESVVAEVEVEKVVKPVESKRKFKVGDKVRVLDVSFAMATSSLDVGDITKVVGYKEDFREYELLAPKERPVVVAPEGEKGFFEESALELAEEKTPNELRAEIIEEAKLFLSEEKGTIFEFVIQDRRILVLNNEEKLFAESKCNPNDVFNEHIGKAIALGRALGKDVSEFENAVQPNFEIGQIARFGPTYEGRELEIQVTKVDREKLWFVNEFGVEMYLDTGVSDVKITNDTNAQYKEGVE